MIEFLHHRLLRGLAALALLIALPCWALTTTPSGDFLLGKGDNTQIDFLFTVQADPGQSSHVFWAQQFWFEQGARPGGYLGLQRVGGEKKILFAIWDAQAAVALMPGAVAEPFGGEGTGQHVIAPFDWQVGHTYRFQLWGSGGDVPWWGVSVTDQTLGARWDLGWIQGQASWGHLQGRVTTFTEVFVDGEHCERIPYARALFGPPESDQGRGVTVQRVASTYGEFPFRCPLLDLPGAVDGVNVGTRSDVVGDAIVHQIGLSQRP